MYVPASPPQEYSSRYLISELKKIKAELSELKTNSIIFTELHAPPEKPQDGAIYNADGTNWNPGSGAGLYEYISGSYTKL